MKTIVIGMLRHLLIPVGFIWAAGIFTTIQSLRNAKTDTWSFTKNDYALLEMHPLNAITYSDSLVKARDLQNTYTAMEYFRDIQQFEMFRILYQDSLNETVEGRVILMHTGLGIGIQPKLTQRFQEGARKATMSTNIEPYRNPRQDEIAKARSRYFPTEISDAEPLTFRSAMQSLGNWVWGFYLKAFPFALLMLVIWRYRLKRHSDPWNNVPEIKGGAVSFAVSLLFWPIVLVLDIRNRWKQHIATAEILSRRTSLLSPLSQQEKRLVALGRTMKVSKFRIYLGTLGLERQHSFAVALLVTVCLSLLPRILCVHHTGTQAKQQTIKSAVIQADTGSHTDFDVGLMPTIVPCPKVTVYEIITALFFDRPSLYSGDYSPDIGKIPLMSIQLR